MAESNVTPLQGAGTLLREPALVVLEPPVELRGHSHRLCSDPQLVYSRQPVRSFMRRKCLVVLISDKRRVPKRYSLLLAPALLTNR